MEKLLTLRGMAFGALGGLLAWVFMKLMAEPIIERAIDYESGRDEAKEALEMATGHHHAAGAEAELFSRGVQSTFGAATGMMMFGIAMGGLAAVVLALWLHHRRSTAIRPYVAPVVALVFAVMYVIPSLKYPANPPSVGNGETIATRTGLYLAMVLVSAIAVVVAVVIHDRLGKTMGSKATWLGVAVAAVIALVGMWALPALGELSANAGLHSLTETPQPLTDDSGTIVFPGFPADDLYRFRLYSFIAQMIIWASVAVGFAGAARRIEAPATARDTVSSGV